MKFSKNTTLAEVLEFGGAEEILAKFKVPCLGCPMAKSEMGHLILGQICATYEIDETELIKELNVLAKKFTKK
jgi:hypothetical protein